MGKKSFTVERFFVRENCKKVMFPKKWEVKKVKFSKWPKFSFSKNKKWRNLNFQVEKLRTFLIFRKVKTGKSWIFQVAEISCGIEKHLGPISFEMLGHVLCTLEIHNINIICKIHMVACQGWYADKSAYPPLDIKSMLGVEMHIL